MALLFIDFDRTLYDHDEKTIHKPDIEALIQAKNNGHKLFLSTGRPYIHLDGILPDNLFEGGIFSCGAKVNIQEKTIYLHAFEPTDIKMLISSLLERKIDFTVDGDTRRFLTPFAMEIFNRRCQSNELEDCEFNLFAKQRRTSYPIEALSKEDYQSILKISIYARNYDVCEEFISQLPDKFRAFIHPNLKDHFIGGEIALKSINKSIGLQKILEYYGEPNIETIAIGDSKNDVEILKRAKLGICMGNGCDEAKEAADFITKPIQECGIAYALHALHILDENK